MLYEHKIYEDDKIIKKIQNFIEINGKIFKVRNVEDLKQLRKTKEYKKLLKNFADILARKRKFNFLIRTIFEKEMPDIFDIKLNDTFVPFYHFIIDDILTYIEDIVGEQLVKQGKNYKELKEFCNNFQWLRNFYTQIELMDLTPQQTQQTKINLELFEKYYKEVFKNALKLYKKTTVGI